MFALQDLFKIETYSNGWNSILQRWSRQSVDRNKLSTDISDVSIETIETIESPLTPATGKGWSRFVRKSVMGANAPVFSFNRKNSEVNATEKNPKKKLKKKPKTRWFPFGKVAVASKREDELVTVTPMEVEIGCLAADEKCSVVTGKIKASVVEDPQLFLPAGSDVVAVLASGEPGLEILVSTPLTESDPAVQENQITDDEIAVFGVLQCLYSTEVSSKNLIATVSAFLPDEELRLKMVVFSLLAYIQHNAVDDPIHFLLKHHRLVTHFIGDSHRSYSSDQIVSYVEEFCTPHEDMKLLYGDFLEAFQIMEAVETPYYLNNLFN